MVVPLENSAGALLANTASGTPVTQLEVLPFKANPVIVPLFAPPIAVAISIKVVSARLFPFATP